jgi:dTDP-4-amino-4,6-dideoxygalactose transaminase
LSPVPLFDLHDQHGGIAAEIQDAVARVLASQRFILGPQVAELEQAMAARFGVRHAIACASGTDALLLPLRDLAIRSGADGPATDRGSVPEVVVPAFTFFATAGAVWNAGLRPAFCDVDADTFNATAETVRAGLGAHAVAALPVHLFGQMAEVEKIRAAVGERVFLLEDVAQATGARRRIARAEVAAGAWGDAGSFSFFPTKNLGGIGDGGLITTADDGLAERLRKLRVHGGLQMYHHDYVGTNSRLDTLQAALLLAKLPHLDRWLDARRGNAALYDELLADVEPVRTPVVAAGNHHTYNQYTVRVERRDELRAHLTGGGIGSGVYYPAPLHLQPCFGPLGYAPGDFPVAERLCAQVLSLPIYPELDEERVRAVADGVKRFYKT